jgi:diguanylate cyclase (GGDEF)-like protein/PAS domain S-box-containing protein
LQTDGSAPVPTRRSYWYEWCAGAVGRVASVRTVTGCDVDAAAARALLVAAPDLVGITDADGRIRYVNAAAFAVLGFEPAAMVGTSVFDYIHGDERDDAVASLLTTVARSDQHGVPLQLRLRRADGTWRAVELVATNLLDDPSVRGMVLRVADLSHRDEDERRQRLIFEQSPVAQALAAPGQGGIIANAAFALLFATTREDLLGIPATELVHPDDREAMRADWSALRAGDTARVFGERRYVRRDGSEFNGRSTTSVLNDPDGRGEYLFTTIEDVSLQLRAAEALARSEARARALVENSPDIIAILYPDGNWEASDQGTRLLGYPKGFDPPGGVFSLIHPDDIAAAGTAMTDVLAGTRAANTPLELRLRAADGTYQQFECVGQNLSDDPHVGGVVITARDITQRKHADARLRAAEQRFRVTFEHAPLCVSIVDLDGNIVDINAAGCDMLGYTRTDLIGRPAELAVHPDDRYLAIDLTTQQLAGRTVPAEFRLVRADGQVLHALSHASLVEPADPEQAPYVITLQTDITDRKLLEHELERRASHDHLTGLSNRASLHHHLDHVLQGRDGPTPAVVFIDLDNFKMINDTHGHEAGDAVLADVAERISRTVRRGDLVARLGGDEFVVVGDTHQDIAELAERIRLAIQADSESATNTFPITASLGIAISEPGDDPAALLRRADAAAYVAKRAGKNRVETLTHAPPPPAPLKVHHD